MVRNKILACFLTFCLLATGSYTSVAIADTGSRYDMFAGIYDPKYEGAKSLDSTSQIPSDISPNTAELMFDSTYQGVDDLIREIRKFGGQLDTMQAIIVGDEWKGIEYWVESVKSVNNPSTYYRTQYITFQIGPYKAIDSYGRYRTQAPESLPPNGKWYDMAYITADYIEGLFSAYYPNEDDKSKIKQYFVTEEFLYVGAVIEILGSGGTHKDWIDTYSECATVGTKHGFNYESVDSMTSRWQKVKIGGTPMDIEVTTDTPVINAQPGEPINVTFKVKSNMDVETTVGLTEHGSGWATLIKDFGQTVGLVKNVPQTFAHQMAMPDSPTKVVAGANYKQDKPTSEQTFTNNSVTILLNPDLAQNVGANKEGYLAWVSTYPYTYQICDGECCSCICGSDECTGCCGTLYTNPSKPGSITKTNQIWVTYNGDTAPNASNRESIPNTVNGKKPLLYMTGAGINDIWKLKPGGIWSHYKTAIGKGKDLGFGNVTAVNKTTYPELTGSKFNDNHNKMTSAGYIMAPLAGNGHKVTVTVRTSLYTGTGTSPHKDIVNFIKNNMYVTVPTSKVYTKIYKDDSTNNQVKLVQSGSDNYRLEYKSNFNDNESGGNYENISKEVRETDGICGGSCNGDWLQPNPRIGHFIETTTFDMWLPLQGRTTSLIAGNNARAFMLSLKEKGADKHLGAAKHRIHVRADFHNDFAGLRPSNEAVQYSQRGMHVSNGGNPNNIFYFGIFGNKYDDIQIRQILR